MPQRTVIANWKMHGTQTEARDLARAVRRLVGNRFRAAEVVLAPPFTALETVRRTLAGSRLRLAAQNLYWQPHGAFTGEVSAGMLRDAGCSHVIVGHSERRRLFGENNREVGRKLGAVLEASLKPILCVGETLEERRRGDTHRTLSAQLSGALKGLPKSVMESLTVAYEPVWAIGTGRHATPAQVTETHGWIRRALARRFGTAPARAIPILYGGSVNPDNAAELARVAEVDGVLVGGASLDHQSFAAIVKVFSTEFSTATDKTRTTDK